MLQVLERIRLVTLTLYDDTFPDFLFVCINKPRQYLSYIPGNRKTDSQEITLLQSKTASLRPTSQSNGILDLH